MNNFLLKDHALRIVHSVPDPSKEYNSEANIHIKNIDKDVSQ
jgi:polyadenylate-binding protein